MTLRDYQIDIARRGVDALRRYGIVYLAMEVRTGKTLTALQIAYEIGAKSVLLKLHRERLAAADERRVSTNKAVIDGKMKALDAAYFGIVSQYPEII